MRLSLNIENGYFKKHGGDGEEYIEDCIQQFIHRRCLCDWSGVVKTFPFAFVFWNVYLFKKILVE